MTQPKKKNSDLYSVYQPIVDVKDHSIMGFEALARSTGSAVSPWVSFNAKFHQENQILSLDLDCMEQAIKGFSKLESQQLLFINIEAETLKYFFLLRQGAALLPKLYPLRENMVLELTHGLKQKGRHFIQQAVVSLKKMGFQFAIDDVTKIGPKLSRLTELQPRFIKVDISLVHQAIEDKTKEKQFREILKIAKKIKTKVIAEGVEDKSQLDFVIDMGVDYVQGFYFGKPQRTLIKKIVF